MQPLTACSGSHPLSYFHPCSPSPFHCPFIPPFIPPHCPPHQVEGPYESSPTTEAISDVIVLVAGGLGVTPLLGMLRALAAAGMKGCSDHRRPRLSVRLGLVFLASPSASPPSACCPRGFRTCVHAGLTVVLPSSQVRPLRPLQSPSSAAPRGASSTCCGAAAACRSCSFWTASLLTLPGE